MSSIRAKTIRRMVGVVAFGLGSIVGVEAARADYTLPPAYDMLGASELVVVGTIRRLRKNTFDLRIKRVIAGKTKKRVLRVKRFRNWTCASRWTRYKIGQRVLLLLRHVKGTSPWVIRSAGGEGEMPVVGKHVYVRGLRLVGFKSAKHKVAGKTVYGHRVKLARLERLIRGFRKCFRIQVDPQRSWAWLRGARQICNKSTLQAFSLRGKAEQALVTATKRRFRIP